MSFTRIWFRSGSSSGWEDTDQGHDIIAEWFTANDMLTQLFTNFRLDLIADFIVSYYQVLLVMLLGFFIHLMPEKWKIWYRDKFSKANVTLQLGTSVIVVFILYQLASSDIQPFIYFQF